MNYTIVYIVLMAILGYMTALIATGGSVYVQLRAEKSGSSIWHPLYPSLITFISGLLYWQLTNIFIFGALIFVSSFISQYITLFIILYLRNGVLPINLWHR